LPAHTYHIVAEIWTVNTRGEILLTLRAPDKETYPDKWECTGGSILAGETALAGAVRELREETGIEAREHELMPLGTLRKPGAFYDAFLLRRDIEIQDLVLQPGETADAKWVTVPELHRMIKNKTIAEPIGKRFRKLEHLIR
jgi:8-oxo-dGTP pyrophosphatase MutT (NUDIX family)